MSSCAFTPELRNPPPSPAFAFLCQRHSSLPPSSALYQDMRRAAHSFSTTAAHGMTASNGSATRASANGAKLANKPKDMAHHLAHRVQHQPPSALKAFGALADSRPELTSLAGGKGPFQCYSADPQAFLIVSSWGRLQLTFSLAVPSQPRDLYHPVLPLIERGHWPSCHRICTNKHHPSRQIWHRAWSSRADGPAHHPAVRVDEVLPANRG